MIEKLKILNNKLKEASIGSESELRKYLLIEKILEEENSFLKMDIEVAYALLRDLKIPEEKIKELYLELISIQ